MDYLLFSLATSLGVLVATVMGFAGALIAVPIISLFLLPQVGVPAYTLLATISNLVVIIEGWRHIRWTGITWLTIGGIAGTLAGTWSLAHFPARQIQIGVGVMTLLFGLAFLRGVVFRLREGRDVEIGIGALSGWLGGCISQGGPPMVFFALARGWAKDAFRCNLMAFFTLLHVVALGSYWHLGMMTKQSVSLALVAVIPGILASFAGLWLKNRVDETRFRTAVLVTILVVGTVALFPRKQQDAKHTALFTAPHVSATIPLIQH